MQTIQTRLPSKVGSLGNPPEEPDGCPGRDALERTEQECGMASVSNERLVKSEACGSFLLFGLRIMCEQSMLDMVSSEDEDDLFLL